MSNILTTYLNQKAHAAPLAAFRILFGIMMLLSIVRFWAYGWIDKLYIHPDFFFSYYGFEFVKPLGVWTYALFAICGLSGLFVAVGYRYKISIITFFLSFTYIELMDKTTYLNHYYFISLVSFLMIFLPANAYYSIDAKKSPSLAFEYIPKWSIDAIKLMIGIVYFYAGLAKLNSDWLIEAMPLKIWLPAHYDLPFLGNLLQQEWMIYLFSWGGAFYDLAIPFLLISKRFRTMGFVLVVIFHLMTRILFPIGMFPYIMIVAATLFYSADWHNRLLQKISDHFRISKEYFDNGRQKLNAGIVAFKPKFALLSLFFITQLALPFRHVLYPGELFWNEEGYRFSWRVMLMEKAGYAQFKVINQKGESFHVNNGDFLTVFQEKQMATQPDFILEYAHFLRDHFTNQGHGQVQVFVESYVALNGRKSKPYIDPVVDLAQIEQSFQHKEWVLPFEDEIKGL